MNCGMCSKPIERKVFCCDSCRNKYFRRKKKGLGEILPKEEVQQLPKRIPLAWRDDKGQCQHKRKECVICN